MSGMVMQTLTADISICPFTASWCHMSMKMLIVKIVPSTLLAFTGWKMQWAGLLEPGRRR